SSTIKVSSKASVEQDETLNTYRSWILFEVSGFLGTSIVFSPTFKGRLTEMTWKKGTNKVAEWDGHQFKYYGSLTGRAELSLSSGNLTILSAQAGDTGIYEVEILAEDDDSSSTGMIQRCYYNLNVTGPLLPPGLNCTIVKNRLEIFCHTDLSTNVGYFWWYSNMDRLIWENNIAKLPLTADRSQKIYCIIEVSGGRINGSLSLDECPVGKYMCKIMSVTQKISLYGLMQCGVEIFGPCCEC
uniref:Ig-like domain-containing protein n=1 Tax=Crocodylus porosus TaxID=8502 RepID=A0A7M4E5R9_CROPO